MDDSVSRRRSFHLRVVAHRGSMIREALVCSYMMDRHVVSDVSEGVKNLFLFFVRSNFLPRILSVALPHSDPHHPNTRCAWNVNVDSTILV